MHSKKYSKGLTLIELVTSMVIASVATIGLGTGIASIVGFYQDDWVTKDVRFYGYECIDFIVEKIETAEFVQKREYLANYDGLLIKQPQPEPLLNIQAREHDGLLKNGEPLLKYADFPAEGTYKDEGKRIIALEQFKVYELAQSPEPNPYRQQLGGSSAKIRLKKSLWQIQLVISVTTKTQGEASTEYMKFKRIVWAKDKYFGRSSGSTGTTVP